MKCAFCDGEAVQYVHIYTSLGKYLNSYPGCKYCVEWKKKNLGMWFLYETTPLTGCREKENSDKFNTCRKKRKTLQP